VRERTRVADLGALPPPASALFPEKFPGPSINFLCALDSRAGSIIISLKPANWSTPEVHP